MFQNAESIKRHHKKFIDEIVETETVWSLRSAEGLATSSSVKQKNEDGAPMDMVCFWSNQKLAGVCGRKYWKEYAPSEIPLSIFLENWCLGLYYDDWLIGTNFDWNLFGQENEPPELILEIIEKLKDKNKEIKFTKFKDLLDLENQVKEALEDRD